MTTLKKAFTLIVAYDRFGNIWNYHAAVYITFTSILSDSKNLPKEVEAEFEKLIGGELLRLDLEHAGYGVFKSTSPFG